MIYRLQRGYQEDINPLLDKIFEQTFLMDNESRFQCGLEL